MKKKNEREKKNKFERRKGAIYRNRATDTLRNEGAAKEETKKAEEEKKKVS